MLASPIDACSEIAEEGLLRGDDDISFIVIVMCDCPSGYPGLTGIVLVAGKFYRIVSFTL